jgi:hypothetical protein
MMKKVGYSLFLLLMFPVDLFRFTTDCWRYTFGWIHYRWFGRSEEQPCIFCRGLDVGMVPRRVSFRIKYHNLWLVKILQEDLEFMKSDDRLRPRIACMREGGYIRLKPRVPVLAVLLGLAWNSALVWLIWISGLIPDEAKREILAFIGLEG